MNTTTASPAIILYDGICGLCDWLVQFVLERDTHDRFRFAALQHPIAESILQRHGVSGTTLNTFYVVLDANNPNERVVSRSTAVLATLRRLSPGWQLVAAMGWIIPRPIRDQLYNLVAKNRYRIFGQIDQCRIPSPHDQKKFLDQTPE